MYGATRERDLYRDIKSKITDKAGAVKFAKSVRDAARLYGAIISPDAEFWKSYSQTTKDHLRTLERFSLQQNRPLLLAVLQHFQKAEVEKTVRFSVSWSVRGVIAGGIGGGQAERYICDAAVAIRGGNVKNTAELKLKLAPTIASDTLFRGFERYRTTGNAFARYILLAMERQLGGRRNQSSCPILMLMRSTSNTSFRRSPSRGSGLHLVLEDAAVYAYRVGNMTLLRRVTTIRSATNPGP